MNILSRMITGSIFIIVSLFLISIPFIWNFKDGWWMAWIYGVVLLIIGLFIILNYKEDFVEPVASFASTPTNTNVHLGGLKREGNGRKDLK